MKRVNYGFEPDPGAKLRRRQFVGKILVQRAEEKFWFQKWRFRIMGKEEGGLITPPLTLEGWLGLGHAQRTLGTLA